MASILHITSGEAAGELLQQTAVAGELLVWRDVLYDGPRNPGWPSGDTLEQRADYLSRLTGGGMAANEVLQSLVGQYQTLESLASCDQVLLWFDACLFDQSMLCHLLTCLGARGMAQVELICVDAFAGIEPYHGLGQLTAEQLASCYELRQPVSQAVLDFAGVVDNAFATQDSEPFQELAALSVAPIPWVPAAVARWLEEQPDPATGLGLLERLALAAVMAGHQRPGAIFTAVAEQDKPPQYWGDITLWAKLNALAEREPPLVRISGPKPRLPLWGGPEGLLDFSITPA